MSLIENLYKARNVVERFFLRIKNRRHIATRYDKLTLCFFNFVLIAAIMVNGINLSNKVIKAHRINIRAISLKESITS